jgi:hypothetical protein
MTAFAALCLLCRRRKLDFDLSYRHGRGFRLSVYDFGRSPSSCSTRQRPSLAAAWRDVKPCVVTPKPSRR